MSGSFRVEQDVLARLKGKQLRSEHLLLTWKPLERIVLLDTDPIVLIEEINVFPRQLC